MYVPHVKAGTSRSAAAQRKAKFVEQYFILNRNGGAAAIAAGYSAKTCYVTASQLLRDPKIRAAVDQRAAELAAGVSLTAQEVIASLARALRFDPRKLYYADGSMKKITELTDDVALELEGVDIEQVMRRPKGSKTDRAVSVTTAKVNFPKKSSARDQAMKHFGLYAKDKQGFNPEDDETPPAPIAVTINFKDARCKPKE